MPLGDEFHRILLDNLYDGVYFVTPDRTIVYWNDAAERMTGFTKSEMVGTHCWDNLLMHVDRNGVNLCLGRCPLEKSMQEDLMLEEEVYFHHKEGHRVPVMVRVSPVHDTSGAIIGGVEIFSNNSRSVELIEKIEELTKLALLDPLTRIGNRQYGELNLAARLNELERYGWFFGVLFMDIDHFKNINDLYGHEAGDRVLRMVAATINNGLRSSDVVSRWGGEEFIALFPNVDGGQLMYIANKLRMLVEKSSISLEGRKIEATISVAAIIAHKEDTTETLLRRADELMCRSKTEGRNCVSIEA
ncbi:MAG: sensor domain-containing diguanylate cyclase [Syntrophus sp. (in: bacteria)]|nr:sensor domain-containing diguanylate cyclase [Syntrophus sp. (in: bacteria)]